MTTDDVRALGHTMPCAFPTAEAESCLRAASAQQLRILTSQLVRISDSWYSCSASASRYERLAYRSIGIDASPGKNCFGALYESSIGVDVRSITTVLDARSEISAARQR